MSTVNTLLRRNYLGDCPQRRNILTPHIEAWKSFNALKFLFLYSVRVIELRALHSSPYFPICNVGCLAPSLHSHSFKGKWLLYIWKHLFIAFSLFFLAFKGLTVSSLPSWVLPGRGKHSRIQNGIEFEASCSSKEYGVSSQSNQAFLLRWLRTLKERWTKNALRKEMRYIGQCWREEIIHLKVLTKVLRNLLGLKWFWILFRDQSQKTLVGMFCYVNDLWFSRPLCLTL